MTQSTGKRMQAIYTQLVHRQPEPVLVQDLLPANYSHSQHVSLLNAVRKLEKRGIVITEKIERPSRKNQSYERAHLLVRLSPSHLGQTKMKIETGEPGSIACDVAGTPTFEPGKTQLPLEGREDECKALQNSI